ncbi:MAG: ubiquinone/menaquinone biosynthesis methyltransferase [Bacteroidetes bacterium]|nr:ubiquinone/menaquinone biosynthesis methyltransferase [Bacteroidota bacterium]
MPSRQTMAAMFNSIAAVYDRVNRITSFGLDGYWRNRLIGILKERGSRQALDIACGTGALSWAINRKLQIPVTGLDLSAQMIHEAEKKKGQKMAPHTSPPVFREGCAEKLPFADQSFDAVTIAFGIRNVEDRAAALSETNRVLKSGGSLLILDFGRPDHPVWRFVFRCYFFGLLPLIGYWVSGNKEAYRYLPRSVDHFPKPADFCRELTASGYSHTSYISYTGGVAILYSGIS